MVSVHLGPKWFFGIDASLEAFASLISFFVTFASFRIWKMTKERKYFYFTLSFFLLTLSFLSRAVTDIIIENVFFKCSDSYVGLIFFIGYVLHIVLAVVAYTILLIVTHKLADKRIIALLFMILIPSLLLSGSYYLSFYGLSFILLLFITLAYYSNCRKVCKKTAYFVFVAFACIALSQLFFLFEFLNIVLYAVAHVVQAIGYLILLLALIKALK